MHVVWTYDAEVGLTEMSCAEVKGSGKGLRGARGVRDIGVATRPARSITGYVAFHQLIW